MSDPAVLGGGGPARRSAALGRPRPAGSESLARKFLRVEVRFSESGFICSQGVSASWVWVSGWDVPSCLLLLRILSNLPSKFRLQRCF